MPKCKPVSTKAFSSEVAAGSREENASKQETKAFSSEVAAGSREATSFKEEAGGVKQFRDMLDGFSLHAMALLAGLAAGLPGVTLAQSLPPMPEKATPGVVPFTFAAIGDMPYELPSPPVKFDRLINAINAAKPDFTIHIGDIISGRTACSEQNYSIVKQRFGRFNNALIYTPGDNEWTDCHRMFGGNYNPEGRLDIIRRMFFVPRGRSLGIKQMLLVPQPRIMPQFSLFVENRRFEHKGIVFTTVHIVGSQNNMRPDSPGAMAEFQERNKANLAWIKASFDLAIARKAPGLVFGWQANLHATPRFNRNAPFSPAFIPTIDAIEAGARRYRGPVLVISGDFHTYDVSPFLDRRRQPVENVTRLQVFGDGQVHGVLVTVRPKGPQRFLIKPLLLPANR